jgi:hypothetical protein
MRISSLLASAALAATLAALASPASATPFTWNPSATTGTQLSNAGAFTASNITINDFAVIDTANPAVVTESAILSVQNFNVATPGLVNNSGIAQTGANAYALYFTVTATSHLAPAGPGLFGSFDTLSYTLWGDVGGHCTFSASAAGPASSCGGDTQLSLATGSLSTLGTNQVSIVGGIPSAAVDVTIANGANAGTPGTGFWVLPTLLAGFQFETSFTNTLQEITTSGSKFIIGASTTCNTTGAPCPGGGTIDLIPIPEPLTLSVFGAGLAGAAALRRRKAKKA